MHNRSDGVSFGDFSQIDVFARYTDTTGDTTTNYLAYPSEWSVVSISGDNTTPNIWDPDETATISFSLQPQAQVGTKGTVAVAVPGGILDSTYFDAPPCFYLHNDPTPPTADTASQSLLPMDEIKPSATNLFNYDTNRDAVAGLFIKHRHGGGGLNETKADKHQVWRTSSLANGLAITWDVSIDLWAAIKLFELDVSGTVTIYLRDYDGVSAYTEIGEGTIVDTDWQGGSNTFVKKTITILGLNCTIPAGHELEAKLVVGTTSDHSDMWLAYDTTSYLSAVQLP